MVQRETLQPPLWKPLYGEVLSIETLAWNLITVFTFRTVRFGVGWDACCLFAFVNTCGFRVNSDLELCNTTEKYKKGKCSQALQCALPAYRLKKQDGLVARYLQSVFPSRLVVADVLYASGEGKKIPRAHSFVFRCSQLHVSKRSKPADQTCSVVSFFFSQRVIMIIRCVVVFVWRADSSVGLRYYSGRPE